LEDFTALIIRVGPEIGGGGCHQRITK